MSLLPLVFAVERSPPATFYTNSLRASTGVRPNRQKQKTHQPTNCRKHEP
ncbi:hypothetical protein [Calothrix sp. NIES-2098]